MEKELNIIYTCDNNYLELASISMQSIVYNNPSSIINFYLATESNNHYNYTNIVNFYKNNKNVKIHYLDCKKYDDLLESKKVDKWGSSSYYVYRRLFAYELLDVDYAWYIDTDILCLKEIINPKLAEDKVVGMVIDSAHANYNKIAHINENYYFYNTGTMFVDVKKWKNNNCNQKIIDYISNMKYRPLMCDQDIITIALQELSEPIDNKYDFFAGYDYYGVHNSFKIYSLDKKPFYSENEIIESSKNIIFYHCLDGVFGRPWEKNNFSPIKKEFEKYRNMSLYPNFSKERKTNLLFKVEKAMEFLPDPIYNKLHNFAIRLYLHKMKQKA